MKTDETFNLEQQPSDENVAAEKSHATFNRENNGRYKLNSAFGFSHTNFFLLQNLL